MRWTYCDIFKWSYFRAVVIDADSSKEGHIVHSDVTSPDKMAAMSHDTPLVRIKRDVEVRMFDKTVLYFVSYITVYIKKTLNTNVSIIHKYCCYRFYYDVNRNVHSNIFKIFKSRYSMTQQLQNLWRILLEQLKSRKGVSKALFAYWTIIKYFTYRG